MNSEERWSLCVGIRYANLPNEFQADGTLPAHDIDRPVCRGQFQFSTLEDQIPASASKSDNKSALWKLKFRAEIL